MSSSFEGYDRCGPPVTTETSDAIERIASQKGRPHELGV